MLTSFCRPRSRPNGATATFRRTSTNATATRENPQGQTSASNSGVYIPPHLNANYQSGRNGVSGDSRYNKNDLLDIYQRLYESNRLDQGLDELFQGAWDPRETKNGTGNTWNGRTDAVDSTAGPEVCWDARPSSRPFGLQEMSADEKELFETSVNSPLKLPTAKEAQAAGATGGRKTSISAHQGPGPRRRDTSDSFTNNGPLSPTGSKPFFRDEPSANQPPPSLIRRRTGYLDDVGQANGELKETTTGDEPSDSDAGFGSLRRSQTGPLSAGLNGPSNSPWSAGPSAFDSMGSFGSFAVGNQAPNQDGKTGFGSGRGGSRFKDLLSKQSAEEMSPSVREKASLGNLEKLPEEGSESGQQKLQEIFKTRQNRSETNPYESNYPGPRGGSAALGGARDLTSPGQGVEQMGFSSFGIAGNIGSRDFSNRDSQEVSYQHTPHSRNQGRDHMSPTNTNPYQSPHGDRGEGDDNDTNDTESQPSNLGFGSMRRNIGPGMDERPNSRGLQGLGGLGGLPGFGGSSAWGSSGTPGRGPAVSSPFGDPIFSPMTDLQSPGAGGLGGSGFFGSQKQRPSKLGALFPPAMQEQMREPQDPGDAFAQRNENFQSMANRDPFGNARQRDDYRVSGLMDERNTDEKTFSPQSAFQQASGTGQASIPITAAPPTAGSDSSGSLPTAQQKQMVMPDRMRWVYRDPQGKMQGPWSGLEMHDWFKAGFFTAELQVKKLEDVDYEPLAQLVRRIGNSREPFLVPQIGVPHGPASATQGNHWASPTIPGAGTPSAGSAQPPFASSFPSFGTTLTAEQQNALERRKQEEQFLMARQKEHLAQQQVLMKQALSMQQGGPHGIHSLQHASSAHSLQSQPSFGSITSPSGYQPSPMQAPIHPPQNVPGFYDGGRQQAPTSNMGPGPIGGLRGGRDDDLHGHMDRMSLNQRASQPFGQYEQLNDPVASMLHDRARLQMEQQQSDMRQYQDAFLGQPGQGDRLREFQTLRGEADDDRFGQGASTQPIGAPSQRAHEEQFHAQRQEPQEMPVDREGDDLPSLSQQVRATQEMTGSDPTSPWGNVEKTSHIPPPLSISPLPAPAAQRNSKHVVDALAAESRSQSQTPVETPSSLAPWAERTTEITKGPSLKQIQEAEAKRAAEQAAIAAAARQAQLEQEFRTQAQVPAPAPGLPTTSTWGSATSPATPTTPATPAWGKTIMGKPVAVTNGKAQKSLAQIQKDEEARKSRAAAAASAQAAAMPIAAGGKRYAELASKAAPALLASTNSAWTTVGSGGKAKAPTTIVATPQAPTARTISSTIKPAQRPALTARPSAIASQSKAAEEFSRWAKGALGTGLNKTINSKFLCTLP
jgi:PERQ amino acid-rich with GYF domain-containing protein